MEGGIVMKRYIIEIDDLRIWSYEVQGTSDTFSCKLLKPHGDKYYLLGESQDYWDWFLGETSLVTGAEIDICFLYLETAREKFKRIYELIPDSKFSFPEKTDWKSSELSSYFIGFRDTKNEVTFADKPDRLLLETGETFVVNDMGNFCLINDVADSKKDNDVYKKSIAYSDKTQQSLSSKKSRIKVYYPKEQREKTVANIPKIVDSPVEKDEKLPVLIRDKTPADCVKEDVPSEKITAEDLQRYIERKTEGQCDTVIFRASVNYTQK